MAGVLALCRGDVLCPTVCLLHWVWLQQLTLFKAMLGVQVTLLVISIVTWFIAWSL